MRTLYIDTSSSYLYTGIVDNNILLIDIKEELSQKLSQYALPKIASMFECIGLTPKDIDKIIVVNGPGSFTGIRVGLTIAKVYAWSLQIPITTITSLEAMALSSSSKKIKVPIIDARRDYSYVAIFDSDREILKPQYISNNDLKEILATLDNYCFITNNDINIDGEKCSYNPDILNIVNNFVDKDSVNPHVVNPEYLKLTEAEESRM